MVFYKKFILLLVFFSLLIFHENVNSHVFEDNQSNVHHILENYFHQPIDSDISVHLLSGGYSTASNFHVKIADKQYVLRLYKREHSFIEFQKEAYALQEAERVGVFPHIYAVCCESRAILMDYISEKTVSIEQAKLPIHSIKIAEAIRQIHTIEKNPYPSPSFVDKMETFYLTLMEHVRDTPLITKAIQLIRVNHASLVTYDEPQTHIHGDLNPRNIFITDQGVQFIDWCDTNWDDPFYDLAYFAICHDYSEKEEQLLLSAYLQHSPTPKEKNRFSIVKKIRLAGLCLAAHRLMTDILSKSPSQTIDPLTPFKDLSYYVSLFAKNDCELSAQFFFELAQCTIQLAYSL